ncbi:MAG: ABC transporter permease subunit, partial [Thermoguttaceae bacterium]|nr:ABC transporter permease subunit [Thermoguttaceae bacterium]
ARTTRSSMLDVLRQDYLRTARAKGVSNRKVVWRDALRNALIPIITVFGTQLGGCFGGALVTENVFTYPGGKRDSGIEDASIVATHMILAAKDAGVESCWLNFFDPDALAKELELPENEEILMALDLGYPAEGAAPLPNHTSRKPLSETVSYK